MESSASAVLLSIELRDLILEAVALKVARFRDMHECLRLLALCKHWHHGSGVLRSALEQHWKLSSHSSLPYDEHTMSEWPDGDGPVPVVFRLPSGCLQFRFIFHDFTDLDLPYGLPNLLTEMGESALMTDRLLPLAPRGSDVSALTQAGSATYAALAEGGVCKFDDETLVGATPAHEWLYDHDTEDEVLPHSGIAVALGLCFVADCVQHCVIALDAVELKVRFKFGYAELRNPLGVAWHEGLLWVADGNDKSHHASPQGKLVAFSFAAPGPLAIHTITGLDMPVGLASAHGRLHVTCRDEKAMHCFKPGTHAGLDRARAGYTVRGMLMMRDACCALTARGWSPAHAVRARALTLCAPRSLLAADYLAQGARSAFDSAPRSTLRTVTELYQFAVHPELPVAIAVGNSADGRPSVEVFWSRNVLGCEGYDLYKRSPPVGHGDDSSGDDDDDDDDDNDDEEEEEDDDDGLDDGDNA